MGKVVISAFSEDVTTAFSDAQMCGRGSGSEVAIHGMRKFQEKNSDAVILVNAANAFNNLNQKVLLHNIKVHLSRDRNICEQLLFGSSKIIC